MEWIKDQIEWLGSVSKESASRLAEKMHWIETVGREGMEGNETVRRLVMESDKKQL